MAALRFLQTVRPAACALNLGVLLLHLAMFSLFFLPYLRPGLASFPLFGYLTFFAWVAFCVAAVLMRRPLAWAAVALLPVCALAWLVRADWHHFTAEVDEYGFYPWGAIALFSGMCLAVAGTAVLSVVLTASDAAKHVSAAGISSPDG